MINGWWRKQGQEYSIKDGYNWLKKESIKVDWFPYVWYGLGHTKVMIHPWMVAHNKLKPLDRLQKFNITTMSTCYL